MLTGQRVRFVKNITVMLNVAVIILKHIAPVMSQKCNHRLHFLSSDFVEGAVPAF